MLLAFVFNLVLPLFVSSGINLAQASEPDSLAALIGNKVLLCTTEGYKWVSLDTLSEQSPAPESSGHYKCPLCFLQIDKSITVIDSAKLGFYTPVLLLLAHSEPFVPHRKRLRLLLSRETRAPPVSILPV